MLIFGVLRAAQRLRERAEQEAAQSRDADDDRARLAAALDEAQGRESALQAAAQDASDALDRAIEEIRVMIAEGVA